MTTGHGASAQTHAGSAEASIPFQCKILFPMIDRSEPFAATKPKLLLAEDNLVNQKVTLGQLRKLGYDADVVFNGSEVLLRLAQMRYDIVLMDCHMPGVDGYESTRRIRESEAKEGRRTVIIAITANAVDGDREKCLAAGMDDYLPKPLNVRDLAVVLAKWANRAVSNPNEPVPALPEQKGVVAPVDFSRMNEFSQGDASLMNELAVLYLDQTTAQLQEMKVAIAAGNARRLEIVAHNCLGASATCGMNAMVGPLQELERAGKRNDLRSADAFWQQASTALQQIREFLKEHHVG
jgi:CheY-like chemotaxis protein